MTGVVLDVAGGGCAADCCESYAVVRHDDFVAVDFMVAGWSVMIICSFLLDAKIFWERKAPSKYINAITI